MAPVYPWDGPLRYGRATALGVQGAIRTPVITFDAGQTLVELDLDFLAARLGERGVIISPDALAAAAPAAWRHYDTVVDAGHDHGHAWRALFTRLLADAGIADPEPHVAWLWAENPRANLWRKPIAGMVELARELGRWGVTVAVLSNSEGGLAELLADIGIADAFAAIIDSGRVGFEKPDRRIFEYALEAVGAAGAEAIHIGDSWDADIVGARAAGWRAIWYPRGTGSPDGSLAYGRRGAPVDDPSIAIAHDPSEVRAALARWGVARESG